MANTVLSQNDLCRDLAACAVIPEQTLGYLASYLPDSTTSLECVNESWQRAWDANRWVSSRGCVTFPLVGAARHDLVGVLKPNNLDGEPWRLTYVGPDKYNTLDVIDGKSPVPQNLYDVAFIDWERMLAATKDALPEAWGFAPGDSSVFRSYLVQTYARLAYERKVCVSDKFGLLVFNSGLVTTSYEDIFLCFRRDSASRSGWSYEGSCVAGEGILGKTLLDAFFELPKRARYHADVSELVFDGSRGVVPDYRHIIADNLGRFPVEYVEWRLHRHPRIAEALARAREACKRDEEQGKRELRKASQLAWDDVELRGQIRGDVDAAVGRAVRRARWNLRTAVPAYYPRRKTMTLLLPLCVEREGVEDLAMALSMSHAGTYKGETVLTMQMAYMNARLVNRPESEWLHL